MNTGFELECITIENNKIKSRILGNKIFLVGLNTS